MTLRLQIPFLLLQIKTTLAYTQDAWAPLQNQTPAANEDSDACTGSLDILH